jgi:hypothetical protein
VFPPPVVHVRVSRSFAGSATGCATGLEFVALAGSLSFGTGPGQLTGRPLCPFVHTTGRPFGALPRPVVGAAGAAAGAVGAVVVTGGLEAAPAGSATEDAVTPAQTTPEIAAAVRARLRASRG